MTDINAAIAKNFIDQAGWCERLGSPFSARLLELCNADLVAQGIVFDLMDSSSGAPHMDAVGLRLIGALHYAALAELDDDLAAAYPGGGQDWDMSRVWPAAESFMIRKPDWVRRFMVQPPQTNETRRAILLLTGFLHLARMFDQPMHVLELGASAGLNMNWDRFFYRTGDWSWGNPSAVRISTDWYGPPPPLFETPVIASRAACDRHPLDLSDPETRLRVKSYVWADQTERLNRFDEAADLAVETGVRVEPGDAAEWLADKLSARPKSGLTVIYHSVFFQYPPRETRRMISDLIEAAGEAATPDAPVAWLRFEPEALFGGAKGSMKMNLDIRTWPGDETRVLAASDGHVTQVRAY